MTDGLISKFQRIGKTNFTKLNNQLNVIHDKIANLSSKNLGNIKAIKVNTDDLSGDSSSLNVDDFLSTIETAKKRAQ